MATFTRSLAGAAIAAAGVAALMTAGPATASAAAPRNGVCEAGEFCLYYLEDRVGSVSDFDTSIPNYGTTQPTCYEFRGPGLGQGQCVKNNARSVWNRRSGYAGVYFNSNYGGDFDSVRPNDWRNLDVTFDENASHLLF